MEKRLQFTDRNLIKLILPIFIERLLAMLVGVLDMLMISYVGEAAVSGVSLVNQLNNVYIFIFGAAASGGAVIVSQYIGKNNRENSGLAAGQLIMITSLISSLAMLFSLIFCKPILSGLFGSVDSDVMNASRTYLILSALSFPALAIQNALTAIFRAAGKTAAVMKIAFMMNLLNVIGNAAGIFVLHWGVFGVAAATLISRAFAAAVSLVIIIKSNNSMSVNIKDIFSWNTAMLKRIFLIAVPSGFETVLFQVSKVALSSIIALFGTMQITANAAAQNISSTASLFCIAMGHAFVTVMGQCVGANDIDAARYFSKRLLRITYIGSFLWTAIITALIPIILKLYNLPQETKQLVFMLTLMLNGCNMVLCPLDFSLSDGLRATGDARYTMFSSLLSSVVCRLIFAVVFAVVMKMEVIGIALAIICDRIIKAFMIAARYINGKWTKHKII